MDNSPSQYTTIKECRTMTKKAMIDYIEQSQMVINFSRAYYNRQLKEQVAKTYHRAVEYVKGLANG